MIGVEFQLLVKEETSARSFTDLLILALWVLMCFYHLVFGFSLFWCCFFSMLQNWSLETVLENSVIQD